MLQHHDNKNNARQACRTGPSRGAGQGFTQLELLVVLIVVILVSVFAVPRFLETTRHAHESAVAGAGSGFATAVRLVHSHWVANGADPGKIDDIRGFANNNVDVGGTGMEKPGYPTDIHGNNSINPDPSGDEQCVNIWLAIMQTPFTIQADGGTADVDYTAIADRNSCLYKYNHAGNMSIKYNASKGTVEIDADSSS